MKSFANSSNVVLVDINKDIAEVMQILAKVLKEKKNIAIYPEGFRTRDGKMNKFKKSFAILAKELNVDVQPYVISGAYELFPTGKKFPKPGKISIEFLDNGGGKGEEACSYCQGQHDPTSSDNPNKAVISLQNDRETNYETYITVQNELVAAYNELRERERQKLFKEEVPYTEMDAEFNAAKTSEPLGAITCA